MDTQLDLHEQVVGERDTESFQITDLESFTWYANRLEILMDRIKQHEAMAAKKRDTLQKIYNQELEKIQSDFISETAELRHNINFLNAAFGSQAFAFIQNHMKSLKGKAKSFKIGKCQFGMKKEADKFAILDKEALIQWAYANGQDAMVRVEESVVAANVQNYYKETGEIPDGYKVTEGGDKLFANITGADLFSLTGQRWDTVNEEDNNAEPNGNVLQQSGGDVVLPGSVAPDESAGPSGSPEGAA